MSMEGIIEAMAAGESFVQTHIANVPAIDEEIVGEYLTQFSCKCMAAGQVLMMFGGHQDAMWETGQSSAQSIGRF